MWRQQCLRGTTASLYGTWVVWRVYGSKYLAAETADRLISKRRSALPAARSPLFTLSLRPYGCVLCTVCAPCAPRPGTPVCRSGVADAGWRALIFTATRIY